MAFTPRRIHGEGPQPCSLMIIGSQPGWNEERAGRVFVGKTGEELDRFLDGKVLPARRDVFLTNLYREYRGKNYTYTKDDLARDEPELIVELTRVQPQIIVPLILKPIAIQLIIINTSTSTLKKKTGIVILVGRAARLTIRVIPIPPITNGQKIK